MSEIIYIAISVFLILVDTLSVHLFFQKRLFHITMADAFELYMLQVTVINVTSKKF